MSSVGRLNSVEGEFEDYNELVGYDWNFIDPSGGTISSMSAEKT